jgi:hypothetical protein
MGGGVAKEYALSLDVKNIFAESHTENHWTPPKKLVAVTFNTLWCVLQIIKGKWQDFYSFSRRKN